MDEKNAFQMSGLESRTQFHVTFFYDLRKSVLSINKVALNITILFIFRKYSIQSEHKKLRKRFGFSLF